MDSLDTQSMEWEVLEHLRINGFITPDQMEIALAESQKKVHGWTPFWLKNTRSPKTYLEEPSRNISIPPMSILTGEQ